MASNGAIEDLPVRSLSHIVGNDGSGQVGRQPTNTLVPTSRRVVGDAGLTGGGQLAGDVTIKLSDSSVTSLGKADSAMQPSVYDPDSIRGEVAFKAMTATADQGAKADSALQPSDVGTTVASSDALSQLSHSSIQVNDIILGGSF